MPSQNSEAPQTDRPQRGKDSYWQFLQWAMSSKRSIPSQGEVLRLLNEAFPKDQVEGSDGRAILELASVLLPMTLIAALLFVDGIRSHGLLAGVLVILQALQLYRLSSIVHDMIHRSFFKSKRLNDIFGLILGPFVLFKYYNTRRSHLEHHRHNQSNKDPKLSSDRSGEWATSNEERARFKGRNLVDRLKFIVYSRKLPMLIKYSLVILLFCIFSIQYVFFGTELAPWRFDWRKKAYVAMDILSFFGGWTACFCLLPRPVFYLFLLAPLPLYVSCLSLVFLCHGGWKSIMPMNFNEHMLLCFNINNLSFGRRIDAYLKNFHRFHFEHHVYPQIPAYRLAPVSELLHRTYSEIVPAKKPVRLEYLTMGLVDGVDHWDIYSVGNRKFWARKHIESRSDW